MTHMVQHMMSGEHNPLMGGTIPTFELFMSSWEKISRNDSELATLIKPGLKLAYKYYSKMDHTMAYVVTMRK